MTAPHRTTTWPSLFAPALTLLLLVATARSAAGQEWPRPGALVSAANEIWLIDSRCAAPCGANPCNAAPRPRFYRYLAGCWIGTSEADFLAAQHPALPTCFWVHGNRVDDTAAVERGLGVYRALARRATRPFRYVIWSWPSTRIQGPLRDVRVKAAVSDRAARPLARLLTRMPPDVEISLLGYSFGARLVTGALHLEAMSRRRGEAGIRHPVRVVLLAAALDNDSLSPGGRNGLALCHVERMLVTVNRSDPAMKWYHRLYGCPGPDALGYRGATGRCGGALLHLDVSQTLGRDHELAGYLRTADPACWLGLTRPPSAAATRNFR